MPDTSSPPLAISTWSLHRTLGLTFPNTPEDDTPAPAALETFGPGSVSLLEVPALVAGMGIHRMEICSFHIQTRESAYLSELRGALQASNVRLQTLLIEYGDITHPDHGGRDRAWIARWIKTAGALGAQGVRVIAGKQKPTPDALRTSVDGLRELAVVGRDHGVRVRTENWFALLPGPDEVLFVLDALGGEVGLNGDFGNWDDRADKYAALASIFPRAESCHAKCRFTAPGKMDADDFKDCLDAASSAGFHGPYTLIYDGPGDDEAAHLGLERDFVREYFGSQGVGCRQ